jgi:hypothetical protein
MESLLNFLTIGDGLDVFGGLDDVVMLAGVALVCSDASPAYAHARLAKRRAAGLIGGSPMMPLSPPAVDGSAHGDGYEAAVASARRCAVAYAGAASRLAGAAVPVAIRLAAGQPAIMPELRARAPSDILRAPQRYAPLVQITVGGASGCPGAGVAEVNADLATHHRQLRVSIDRLLGSGAPRRSSTRTGTARNTLSARTMWVAASRPPCTPTPPTACGQWCCCANSRLHRFGEVGRPRRGPLAPLNKVDLALCAAVVVWVIC